MKKTQPKLNTIYQLLYAHFGPQRWWPAESPFEVMVGAILTQNTNWQNVEQAIGNLKRARALTPRALYALPARRLARLIRPAGYYNIKAARLRNFMRFFVTRYKGSAKKMAATPLRALREELLAVNGIGPETADSILLYALGKPVFVIDAYTKRVFSRHQLCAPDAAYADLQNECMRNLETDTQMCNEFHALIVKVAKEYCSKKKPICGPCPLKSLYRGVTNDQ